MLRDDRLTSIDGMPPDLIALPQGCPFAARCSLAIDLCRKEKPQLQAVAEGHKVACWTDLNARRQQ
jgi:oligopeptide transport system ATP-binding protein